ncbi:nitrate reductase delta subunit [Mycobacterium xenopi 3993]|nr:nitrate reductase delta subunit [Mycobacterium xenopi 3993]
MAMVTFKAAYRDAGFIPSEDELPDYLPMVLDFATLCPRGKRLLSGHRTDLELLRRALISAHSPYADVVAAVIATLPGLGKRELEQVRAAWQSGPPSEEVGLEPFAPPDYLAGYQTRQKP